MDCDSLIISLFLSGGDGMNLNQLRYFVTLAQMEHYTKAAQELEISQPSLSHAMNTLENELGTSLFQKQGRNVALTKYGRIFLEYVEESLKTLDLGIAKTRAMTGQTGGVIDLAFIYTLGSEFVPELVADFSRSHEVLDVRFKFTVGNTVEIIQGLKDERFDVAFCSMIEKETSIEFIPVGEEKLVVAVPKGHPLSDKEQVDLEEAAAYPQVYYTKDSGLRPVIDKMFGMARIKPKIAYEIEEDGSMAGLVAQNFGIAIMPDIPILRNLNIEVLKLRNSYLKRQVYMAVSKENYRTPMVKRFTDYVRRVCRV